MITKELSLCLCVVSHLGRLLPSFFDDAGNHTNLYTSETEYKHSLFSMVPTAWRIKFVEMTNQLDNAAYTDAISCPNHGV